MSTTRPVANLGATARMVLVVILVAGCGPSAGTVSPSPTPRETSSASSSEPIGTPTASATAAASPSPVPPTGLLLYMETWLASDSTIHTIGPDGTGDRVIAEGTWPAWSPDGRKIAFIGANMASLLIVDADGGNPRTVVQGVAMRPKWTPDGSTLLYNADPFDFGATSAVGVDGSGPVHLANGDGLPSPDGRWLALLAVPTGVAELTLARADGSDARRVANVGEVAWSPDSRQVAYSWTGPDGHGTVDAVDVMSGATPRLLEFPGPINSLAWIDDDLIAFGSAPDGEAADEPGIYLGNLATGETSLLAPDLRTWWDPLTAEIVVSPGGDWIAVTADATDDGVDDYDIWVVSLEDGATYRVTTSGDAYLPSWRP